MKNVKAKLLFKFLVVLGCFIFVGSILATKSMAAIEMGGVVEAELGYNSWDTGSADGSNSDIVAATVELGIDAQINDAVSGSVVLLWEEDEGDALAVDEATITIANEKKCPFSLTAGRMYIPFGQFESHFVSDPFTLELGETSESAILIGYTKGLANFSFGLFNGDVDESDDTDSHVDNFFANLSIDIESETMPISFGVSYISNIADTDGMEGINPNGNGVDSYVGGVHLFLSSKSGPFAFEAEYLTAMTGFEKNDLGCVTDEDKKPGAWNVELAYEVSDKLEIAGKYEGTMDQEEVGISDESRYGIAGSYELYESTSLALEYLHAEGYASDDKSDTITAQLAIEF